MLRGASPFSAHLWTLRIGCAIRAAMAQEPRSLIEKKPPLRAAQVREARLKAALKANMARRKGQAKLRDAGQDPPIAAQQTPPSQSGDFGKDT